MLKQFLGAVCILLWLTFATIADEVVFEVVGTFGLGRDDVSAIMEGDSYTLTVGYDDEAQGTTTTGDFFSQTEYPILDARLVTSRGLETSTTTGANNSLILNQQGADVVLLSLTDFDLNLESSLPDIQLEPLQINMNLIMPAGSLESQSLNDLASVLDSDVILSGGELGAAGEPLLRLGDERSLTILSSIESVRVVPEPEARFMFFAASCTLALVLRRRQSRDVIVRRTR